MGFQGVWHGPRSCSRSQHGDRAAPLLGSESTLLGTVELQVTALRRTPQPTRSLSGSCFRATHFGICSSRGLCSAGPLTCPLLSSYPRGPWGPIHLGTGPHLGQGLHPRHVLHVTLAGDRPLDSTGAELKKEAGLQPGDRLPVGRALLT